MAKHPTPPRTTAHPWHGVPVGPEAPHIVQAYIEIPKGSQAKFEVDKATGILRLDRVLFSAVHYPANYGFVPQTYADDNDPLDILVFSAVALPAACLVRAKIIGVMRMVDAGELDDKLIAVCADDMSLQEVETLEDLPQHYQVQMRTFFEDYKKLEYRLRKSATEKKVEVQDFLPKADAQRILQEAIALYKETFGSLTQS